MGLATLCPPHVTRQWSFLILLVGFLCDASMIFYFLVGWAFLVDQSQGRKGQWKEALTAANLARDDGVVFDVYTYSVLMRSELLLLLLRFFFLRAREMRTGSLTSGRAWKVVRLPAVN